MVNKKTNNKLLSLIKHIFILLYVLLDFFVLFRKQQIFIKLLRLSTIIILLIIFHHLFAHTFFSITTAVLLTHPLTFWLDFATRRQLAYWQLKRNYFVLKNSNKSYDELEDGKMVLFENFFRNYDEWAYREIREIAKGDTSLFGLDKRIKESVEADIFIVTICFGLGLSVIVLYYFVSLNLTTIFNMLIILPIFVLIVIACISHNYLLSKIVFHWIDSTNNLI